jgi:hypothetical protein
MSDDQVVGRCFDRDGQSVALVGLEASGGAGRSCLASMAEQAEHRGAGVDRVGLKMRIAGEELREEAAVSIAEDESVFLLEEIREKVKAAAFEGAA